MAIHGTLVIEYAVQNKQITTSLNSHSSLDAISSFGLHFA